jgi:predicted dehydrogenase
VERERNSLRVCGQIVDDEQFFLWRHAEVGKNRGIRRRQRLQFAAREGGMLRAEGRGGPYGASRLILHQCNPRGGKPTETLWEFDDSDPSWGHEWAEFIDGLRHGREPMANGVEGLRAMEIVEALYRSARDKKIINVECKD